MVLQLHVQKHLMFCAIIVVLSLSTYIAFYIFLNISSSSPADFSCKDFMVRGLGIEWSFLCFYITFLNYIY